MHTHRRQFLKTLIQAGGMTALSGFAPDLWSQSTAYNGKLLIALQLDGGVDVTSFCDPKTNVVGESEINHWARTQDIQQIGNIAYAPYGSNDVFFERHFQDMLVINGVDAQTNSHTTGVTNNWSGRSAEGYPSLTALMAAES